MWDLNVVLNVFGFVYSFLYPLNLVIVLIIVAFYSCYAIIRSKLGYLYIAGHFAYFARLICCLMSIVVVRGAITATDDDALQFEIDHRKCRGVAVFYVFFTSMTWAYISAICIETFLILRNPLSSKKFRFFIWHLLTLLCSLIPAHYAWSNNLLGISPDLLCQLKGSDTSSMTIFWSGLFFLSIDLIMILFSVLSLRKDANEEYKKIQGEILKSLTFQIFISIVSLAVTQIMYFRSFSEGGYNKYLNNEDHLIRIIFGTFKALSQAGIVLFNLGDPFIVSKLKRICQRRQSRKSIEPNELDESLISKTSDDHDRDSLTSSKSYVSPDREKRKRHSDERPSLQNPAEEYRISRSESVNFDVLDLLTQRNRYFTIKTLFYSVCYAYSHEKKLDRSRLLNELNVPWPSDFFKAVDKLDVTLEKVTRELDDPNDKLDFELNSTIEVFAPEVFQQIRLLDGITRNRLLKSFHPNNNPTAVNAKGENLAGRSDSIFIFTEDRRYVMKSMSPEEKELFVNELLPAYHTHLVTYPNSLVVRTIGIFTVYMRNKPPIDLQVMLNLREDIDEEDIIGIFDLKGSKTDRSVLGRADKRINNLTVLKDNDFVMKVGNLKAEQSFRNQMLHQIMRDVQMFCRMGIMDYSLLLFILRDDEKHYGRGKSSYNYLRGPKGKGVIYKLALIDFLQKYTNKKKGEKYLKYYVIKRPTDERDISSQDPQTYKDRFIAFMDRIIQSADETELHSPFAFEAK
eukprot:TRINITY_DN9579_c0_g1_i1.p1 TRINITY_DN9579_c0_g1~~TRINITY_DN9579_c0_g1_i1.p1  ORF type:complete len:741 (-),score=121.67 TRINITY_DN9579_c0_g1_i1:140-2362(-)